MKKIVSLIVLVFAIVFSTSAQKKRKRIQKERMTPEQHATLAVKKMALHLELSDAQQRKIKPLVLAQAKEKHAAWKQMKEARGKKQEISAEKRFKNANARLDSQIAFQRKMKSILNAEQFEKFKKSQVLRKRMGKRRMGAVKKRMKMRKMKEMREKKMKELKEKDEN